MQNCSICRGTKLNPYTQNQTICPMCDGTGAQFDPGREFTYEMGPFSLNAPAVVAASNPQNFAGAATNLAILNGVSTQIANYRFRWMFAMCVSTFPFAIQIKDNGSGSGRSFTPGSTQVHSRNMFGDGTHPMPLPSPYEFERNQNITADFTDLGGAGGTANATNLSTAVTWNAGALFNTAAAPGPPFPGVPQWNGATISLNGVLYVISAVTSQTTLTLATNYLGATAAVPYSVANSIRVAFKGVELAA